MKEFDNVYNVYITAKVYADHRQKSKHLRTCILKFIFEKNHSVQSAYTHAHTHTDIPNNFHIIDEKRQYFALSAFSLSLSLNDQNF